MGCVCLLVRLIAGVCVCVFVIVCEGVWLSVCNEIFVTKILYKNNIAKILSKEFQKYHMASIISVSALRMGKMGREFEIQIRH